MNALREAKKLTPTLFDEEIWRKGLSPEERKKIDDFYMERYGWQ